MSMCGRADVANGVVVGRQDRLETSRKDRTDCFYTATANRKPQTTRKPQPQPPQSDHTLSSNTRTKHPHKHRTLSQNLEQINNAVPQKESSKPLPTKTHVTQPRRATRSNAPRARNDVRKLSATCCSKRLPTRISIRQNFHPPGGIPTYLNVYPPDSGRNLQQRSSATYSSATWFRHLLRHLDL